MRPRQSARALLVCAALVLAGCADEGPADVLPEQDGAEPTDVTERPDVSSFVDDLDEAAAPESLEIQDVVEGDGAEASAGTVVTVQYVGVAWSTGEEFDASWDRGQPFSFELGAGRVIPGWEQGVESMRVGGRRVLTIPPELAYGASGVPGTIEPDETLVFVVDLLDVEPPG